MVKVIPAHIENGQVIPESPLPEAAEVRGLSIVVECDVPDSRAVKEAAMSRLVGILKGVDLDDAHEDYVQYLIEKYR